MKHPAFRQFSVVALCSAFMVSTAAYAAPPVVIQINGDDLAAGQFLLNPLFAVNTGPMRQGVAKRPKAAPAIPAVTFGFYLGDLQNPNRKDTLQSFTSHNIFVNPVPLSPALYGQSPAGPGTTDVDTFLTHLYASDMIHILDQYTGSGAAVRTVGQAGLLPYDASRQTLYDADIAVLLHASARTFGAGYGQVHHLFFAQGMDVCTSGGGNTAECYSPDVPSTFYFCGFHGYMDFPDLGHVIFSVEPYDNVPGCAVPTSPAGASPNGPAIDSMANVLSHETFEAITDPDLNAWFNHFGILGGQEIADECAFVFALPAVSLNGMRYQIQSEYSNFYHACSWTSSGPPAP